MSKEISIGEVVIMDGFSIGYNPSFTEAITISKPDEEGWVQVMVRTGDVYGIQTKHIRRKYDGSI